MTSAADLPKPASTVVLVRDAPGGAGNLEVLMVRRSAGMAFGASAWVFPGGKVAASDSDPAWDELSDGSYDHYERSLRIAAAREVFEESGLLLATRDGRELDADASAKFDSMRSAVEAEPSLLLKLARDAGFRLTLDRLIPFAHWITPTFEPRRFDTHFFLVHAPADQVVRHDGREAVDHEWVAPQDLLDRRKQGDAKLMFPTRLNLEVLARSANASAAAAAARANKVVTVEPRVEERADGKVLIIPAEAGYGLTEERMKEVMG
ncbi:MAG TPA: NUDIX hydrolase [Hyphomonadaceae bacterium]|jgi:8-oxo-dGTP pyrophosphatase MutT (NUDIX family)|nr:NUDIX hydrolase [Hyphomonadaceae bacterium]HPI50455.1 NUDIX hydrolase [Hyphomonadaceae bacterium]